MASRPLVTWDDLPELVLTGVLALAIGASLLLAYRGGAQDAAVVLWHHMEKNMEKNCVCVCGGGVLGSEAVDGGPMVGGSPWWQGEAAIPGGVEGQ